MDEKWEQPPPLYETIEQPWQQQQQQQQQQQWQQQPPQQQWQQQPQPPQQWEQQQQPPQQWQQQQQQQPQVVYVNQAPVTVITPASPFHLQVLLGRYGPHYSPYSARCSGAWLISMGIVSLAWATTAWMFLAANYQYYDGYWCGGIMLISGCIASHSGRLRKDSAIVTALIAAILSIIFATTQFGISLNGLIYNVQYTSSADNPPCYSFETYCYVYIGYFNYGLAVASNSILMCAGAIAWIPSSALLGNCSRAIHYGRSKVKPTAEAVVVQPNSYGRVIQMEVVSGPKY